MTVPNDIPELFDDITENSDRTADPEKAERQAPSPMPLETDGTDAVAHHAEGSEISAEDSILSSPDVAGLVTSPASSAPAGFLRFSEILGKTEFPERTYIVTHYEDAVRRGIIQAVALAGQSFQVRYWQDDKPTRRTVPDELILRTPELEEWLRVQRLESRYAHRAATSNATTTLEHLESGRDDFQRLAKLRRQLLTAKGKGKEE